MNFAADQIAELKACFGSVAAAEECGVPYLLLNAVALPAGCTPAKADLLLCPVEHSGYPTRLFFSEQVAGPRPLNWNSHVRLCGRAWHAYSWKIPEGTSLRYAQMVQAHLGALR